MSTDRILSRPTHVTARVVSDLGNPLFIPPVILVIAGIFRGMAGSQLSWLALLALLFYTLIPLLIMAGLLRVGKIDSIDIPQQRARNLLFLLGIASTSAGSLIIGFRFYKTWPFLAIITAVLFLNPIIGYLLNRRWKVSIHSASISMGAIILLSLFFWGSPLHHFTVAIFSLFMLLILLPVMMWARYRLNVHTLPELIGGACAGILFTLIEIVLLNQLWIIS